MARIRTYVSDQNITASDKWIGTDGNDNNNTKNFSPNNLADFFNKNESLSSSSIRFTYDTIASGSYRKQGTLSFKTELGPTVPISSLTTFMLSRSTQGGIYVDHFLQLLSSGKVVIHKSDNIDIYGFFKVNSIIADITETEFYNVSLSYISGNGALEEDKDYLITLIDAAGLNITSTSQLLNDGEDGINPFISLTEVPPIPSIDGLATVIYVDQQDLLKVDKVAGKELSSNDFTNTLKTKLDGIADGAEVNVNADWNAVSGDAQILNKPAIPSISGLATVEYVDQKDALKVDKITGKGLSTNDYTTSEQTKLAGIAEGAEVNVNADWNATSGDAQILNKPTIPTITGFVPYTGATSDVNLGEFGVQLGNIEFDTTPTNAPTNVGSMIWNDTDGTLDLKLKGGNVTLQIGQETVARVVNKTSTNITLLEGDYQAIRVTGAIGQRPKVDLALANNDLNSATTLGLVTETILNNQEGFVTTSGQVKEINTTGSLQGETWIDGDVLYLSGTIAGRITNIKPIAPIHTVIIGFVEYAHAIHGKIFVKVNNGSELEELHNVSAIAPNNNEVLTYDLATTLWKPKTVVSALGYTPENTSNKSISITLGTSDVLYPSQNAVKTYVDSKIGGDNFANVVYINSTNPSTATIFDLNNPPVTNNNALKADTGNLYIGTDGSTWTYKTSPAGYYTYTITSTSSNFYLIGTTTDAGNNKNSSIQRNGLIKAPKFVTTNGTLSQFVKGDGSLDSTVYAKDSDVVHIAGYETITGVKTFNSYTILRGSIVLSQTTSGSTTPEHTSIKGVAAGIQLTDGSFSSDRVVVLKMTNISTNPKSFEFPNLSGTLALTSDLSAYVSTSTTLSINGTSYDLSNNRSWTIDTTSAVWGNITGKPTTLSGYGITDAYPLSGNPSNFLTSITSLNVTNALGYTPYNATNPNGYTSNLGTITGTGTTNYLPKFTGSTSLGNSLIYDDGTNLGIGITLPTEKLDVAGVIRGVLPDVLGLGGKTAKFLSFGTAPYGIIFRSYTDGTHSIQNQSEASDTTLYPLSLQPLGGNVLIGTTTNNGVDKLQVNGSVKTVSSVAGWAAWLENSATGGSGLVVTAAEDSAGTSLLIRKKDGTEIFSIQGTGMSSFSSSVTATSFVKTGGLSTEFLMADGSVSTGGGGGGSSPVKLTSQTLTAASWALVSGYYTYSFNNINITASCDVSVTPQNSSYLTAYNAQILPYIGVASGVATFYSQFPPSANMIVDIVITQTV